MTDFICPSPLHGQGRVRLTEFEVLEMRTEVSPGQLITTAVKFSAKEMFTDVQSSVERSQYIKLQDGGWLYPLHITSITLDYVSGLQEQGSFGSMVPALVPIEKPYMRGELYLENANICYSKEEMMRVLFGED